MSEPTDNAVASSPTSLTLGELEISIRGGADAFREDVITRLIQALPARYPALAAWHSRHCGEVQRRLPEDKRRRQFWDRMLAGPAAELVLAGRAEQADRLLTEALNGSERPVGEVYLIGGGPGDPDLLTLRALRLLRQADVVLYDRLVAPAVLELAHENTERIYVGKQRDRHPVPQERINELLLRLAGEGRRVARLKGGDPFIFGRGGEEIGSLMDNGVAFQVVPGITAASGCAAYAGIPLTHRDYAQSCVFVTGHRRANGELALDFDALVRPAQTLVFYMGLAGLPELAASLIRYGMSESMPAALVQQGTTANQRVIVGSLSELPSLAQAAELSPPTLVIVGEVVRLRERLAWFVPEGVSGGGDV